jgi:hypothetical protein
MNRALSPAQIRRQASTAVRNRIRGAISGYGLPLRQPEPTETALSDEEVRVGVRLGLIRHHARVRAFAEGARP